MKTLLLLLCALFPLPGHAEGPRILATGNALLEHVQAALKLLDDKPVTQDEGVKASELAGYLAAFNDMAQLGEATGAKFKFKLQPEIPLSQTARVLEKYLKAHPDRLHLPAVLLVEDAYAEVFPNPAYRPHTAPADPKTSRQAGDSREPPHREN